MYILPFQITKIHFRTYYYYYYYYYYYCYYYYYYHYYYFVIFLQRETLEGYEKKTENPCSCLLQSLPSSLLHT